MGILDAHNVNVVGSGEQHIVLAHGFGTDQSVRKYLVPHPLDDHNVILYDNMGSGPTNPEYYDFERYSTLEGHAFDLSAILEELQVASCNFVGHYVSCTIGAIASICRPDLFSKIVMLSAFPRSFNLSSWYLNDAEYFGGFEQEDLDKLFEAMRQSHRSWCSGFAPGGDMDSLVMQEFCRTLFSMRPAIALNLVKTIFHSDLRPVLGLVSAPCHIIQCNNNLALPVMVSDYLHRNLGGCSVVEVMASEGHLPHMSSPGTSIPVLLRHILDITS